MVACAGRAVAVGAQMRDAGPRRMPVQRGLGGGERGVVVGGQPLRDATAHGVYRHFCLGLFAGSGPGQRVGPKWTANRIGGEFSFDAPGGRHQNDSNDSILTRNHHASHTFFSCRGARRRNRCPEGDSRVQRDRKSLTSDKTTPEIVRLHHAAARFIRARTDWR